MRVVRETIFTEKEMSYLVNYVDCILEDITHLARKHRLDADNDSMSAISMILNNAEGLKKMLEGE